MKRIITMASIAAAVAITCSLQSCNLIKKVIPDQTISFSAGGADVVLPVTSDTTNEVLIGNTAVAYNLDSMIKAQTSNALSASNIESVKVSNITLTLSDGDATNNFANFSSVDAAFSTNNNSTGYDIANIQNNPDVLNDSLALSVISADTDLKSYFGTSTTFMYQLHAKLRRATTHDLHCHVGITYTIKVGA